MSWRKHLEHPMRLRVLSDLHNDCYPSPRVLAPAPADVVILAGDIDEKRRGVAWAAEHFDCPVIYVAGNHEYYKGNLPLTLEKMREEAAETPNVHVLENDSRVIGGVRFLGATLWTDLCLTGDPASAGWRASEEMRDFRKIRVGTGYRRLRPADVQLKASITRNWLAAQLAIPFDGPTVVVTHFAPSARSLEGARSGTHLDAYYACDLEALMGPAVALWVHGHVHEAVDYRVNGTRVMSNPIGYPGETTGGDETLVVDLG